MTNNKKIKTVYRQAISLLVLTLVSFFSFSESSSPWPEIRKARISTLLPEALKAANVDLWLVVCRENNNDPLADHIGCENAGGEAVYLFYTIDNVFESLVFSPSSEATALKELKIHDEVVAVPRGKSAISFAASFIKEKQFKSVAVNMSSHNAQADGLSYTQYKALTDALGETFSQRLVSADDVVYEWLSVKLPSEIVIMKEAAKLASQWQIEAYKQVVPGKTTDADLAKILKQKMAEHGVTDAWAPDQNPNVNSGADRGHSHPTDKIIMPGDIIQIDFGVKLFDRWVSDIQRFAYVLKPEESRAPANIQHYWDSGKRGGFAAFSAMKPGVTGVEVDKAQTKVMQETGSAYVMWSTGHPVGYVAHDTGPSLSGARSKSIRPSALKKLKAGMVFAFDGFHSWEREDGTFKTISVEEMAAITADGAEYLIPPQQELILIPSVED